MVPPEGKQLVETDIAIAVPEGCYGRVGLLGDMICIICAPAFSLVNLASEAGGSYGWMQEY